MIRKTNAPRTMAWVWSTHKNMAGAGHTGAKWSGVWSNRGLHIWTVGWSRCWPDSDGMARMWSKSWGK